MHPKIRIPHYYRGHKTSLVFAMFLVSIAVNRQYPWSEADLVSHAWHDARMLNYVADWLCQQYPDEFERED